MKLGHERPTELKDAVLGLCICGHMIYDHSRGRRPSSPEWDIGGCRACENCTKFKEENPTIKDGKFWPYGIGP